MLREPIISDYFYGDEAEQFSYFRIPRLLLTNPRFKVLSTDAKLLYGILFDRMSLSARNGWHDEDGRVYIYYTADEIRADIGCGYDKALKLLAELDTKKGVGLIERIKQGQGKPTKIYVRRFTSRELPEEAPPAADPDRDADLDFSDFQTSEKPMSRPLKSRGADLEKSDTSYPNRNKPEFSYPDPSIPPQEMERERYECRKEVMEQIGFADLQRRYPYDDVDCLLELIVDTLCSTAATMRLGGDVLPSGAVKERYRRLEGEHIGYVIEGMRQTTTQIRNIRAYLLTALYHAPVTMGPYYSAAARHDSG